MAATTNTSETRWGKESTMDTNTTVDLSTAEGFTAARAAWKAAGCPADHPYLTTAMPARQPIVPLVGGITVEMVAAASAMKAAGIGFVERPVWS